MVSVRLTHVALLLLGMTAGCVGEISVPGGGSGAGGGSTPTDGFAQARIRRLTRAEYDAAVKALLATALQPGSTLPTELRQSGFTRNDAQTVDSVFATAADQAAIALANDAKTRLSTVAPCAAGATGAAAEACAKTFIADFGARAFRRPLLPEENTALLALYQVGVGGTGYDSGIALVIRAVLQTPSFLYVTELGNGAGSGNITLSPYEIASELAFLFTGAPPDAALLADAKTGALLDPATRVSHAQRLLQAPSARAQLQTMTLQWLGLDRLDSQSKDTTLFPGFAALKPQLLDEARAFSDEVFFTQQGGVSMLLGADFTVAPPDVAKAYGLSGSGKMSLASTPRRGILSQGAFLAAYSNVADSGPIHRGAAIVRKVLCVAMPNPSDLKIVVTVPKPDPSLTTRERFALHSTNPDCKSCHQVVDPAGFALEAYDTVGKYRTTENGKPIDTSSNLTVSDAAGPFTTPTELLTKLSTSSDVQHCFARNLFRFATTQTNTAGETAFLAKVDTLETNKRGDPLSLLTAFAGSDLFITRSAP